ncbi:MAG: glycoside hydrolase family 3 C-terminal domain-containing protein [Promethearchaeota archaeon]
MQDGYNMKSKKIDGEKDNMGLTPFRDPSKSFLERAKDIVSRMTLKEKISQMVYKTPGIERLDIAPYDWWNECLHGVARAGIATVFPQAIGLAATFNDDLLFEIGNVISVEARAKHHEAVRHGDYGRYKGLTFWSPNINIFRDPRWGRGQETYGEDPVLSGRLAVSFIKGLQGDGKYLKIVATPKHFVVHSGPEKLRHSFDAIVNKKDFMETYLPHFRDAVIEGKAASVMCAYNRTNGQLCCGSSLYLNKILRETWGFKGYVVSDCGAIADFHRHHRVTKKAYESAALAVKNGCDLNCGYTFRKLKKAVKKRLINQETIDTALVRLFEARFRLGMFDPPSLVEYQNIPYSQLDTDEHRELAREAARQSIVLLKNLNNDFLPITNTKEKYRRLNKIAIIGPNADDKDVLLGNYNGTPSKSFTPLEGIKNNIHTLFPNCQIVYAKGSSVNKTNDDLIEKAVNISKDADIVIAFMGLSNKFEGEQKAMGSDDIKDIRMFPAQELLLKRIAEHNQNIILCLLNGAPVSCSWAQNAPEIKAILECWYPGEEAGNAIFDVIFGKYSPAGKLPITIVNSADDLPPFEDYNMTGRTYKYIEKEPLYPFGFGLTYTNIEVSEIKLDAAPKEKTPQSFTYSINDLDTNGLNISVTLKNTGDFSGTSSEVLQIYFKYDMESKGKDKDKDKDEDKDKNKIKKDIENFMPLFNFSLLAFKRVFLNKDEQKTITLNIPPKYLSLVDKDGNRTLVPGTYKLYIGFSQPDERSRQLTRNTQQFPQEIAIELTGTPKIIEKFPL